MKLKTLESRVRYRIKRSKVAVFIPGDFFDLSDQDQITRALRGLIAQNELIKIGYGLYAKTKTSSLTGTSIPVQPLPLLGKEALKKLGKKTYPTSMAEAYAKGSSTQYPTGRIIGVKDRISRKIGYNGYYLSYEYVS